MEKKTKKKKISICHDCLETTDPKKLIPSERGDKKNQTDHYVLICKSCKDKEK